MKPLVIFYLIFQLVLISCTAVPESAPPIVSPIPIAQYCAKEDVSRAIDEMESVMKRWNGFLNIVKETKDGSLAARPLIEMRDAQYAMEKTQVPLCLIGARFNIHQHMIFAIEARLQKLGGADASTISQTEGLASEYLLKYANEIIRIHKCAPQCQ